MPNALLDARLPVPLAHLNGDVPAILPLRHIPRKSQGEWGRATPPRGGADLVVMLLGVHFHFHHIAPAVGGGSDLGF